MRSGFGFRASGFGRLPGSALLLLLTLAFGGCEVEEVVVTEPEVISVESPFRYPVELWDAEVEGRSVVMVHVTEMGAVDSVYVLQPSGEAAFDSAAVTGAYELKFAPGRHGDRRTAMWARLPVHFRKLDAEAGGTE